MPEAPPEIRALAERRAAARRDRDFAGADDLRSQLAEAGWTVVDGPGGWQLEPVVAPALTRLRPADVPSVLGEAATADVTLAWVVEGWPEDVERALASFRRAAGGRSLHCVVADVTGEPSDRWGPDVEVVPLETGTGWAAARNAGLRRARGRIVVALDGSVEAAGDVLGPLEAGLADEGVGVCGPLGIVTDDLREFHRAPHPGDCDAVEGYLMAFRRETLERLGGFDERFRWYRTADVEWSFRVKAAGLRVAVVDAPIVTHEHRMWEAIDPAEREARSRRNYARFLDRWRDRWDLTVAGAPTSGGGL